MFEHDRQSKEPSSSTIHVIMHMHVSHQGGTITAICMRVISVPSRQRRSAWRLTTVLPRPKTGRRGGEGGRGEKAPRRAKTRRSSMLMEDALAARTPSPFPRLPRSGPTDKQRAVSPYGARLRREEHGSEEVVAPTGRELKSWRALVSPTE